MAQVRLAITCGGYWLVGEHNGYFWGTRNVPDLDLAHMYVQIYPLVYFMVYELYHQLENVNI